MSRSERLPSFEDYGVSSAENGPTGPRGPKEQPATSQRIVELVTVEKMFTPAEMRKLLGNVSLSTYYRLTKEGLLKYTKIPGGRRHTQQQYADLLEYLNDHPDNVRPSPSTFPTRPGARRK